MKNIIEKALWLGLLISIIALVGVLAVLLSYITVGLIKIAPVIGYIMVAVMEIALAVKTVRKRNEEGVSYAVAGVIYALAIILI